MKLAPDQIARLSPDERLALIAQLWDSLDEDQIPITTAQQRELQRRLESLEDGRVEGTNWEDLKAELEKRCP
ncbi:MAG TPA: addiction module protein [Micropepsaceae bacterium]|nr:addiction module protein [Micropepsaceae bacterium]